MTESTTLLWGIDFLSGDDINRVTYQSGTDPIGQEYATKRGTAGDIYHFNLTSKSPLSSTMTTNIPTDLSGATVSCSNGLQGSDNVAILALHRKYE